MCLLIYDFATALNEENLIFFFISVAYGWCNIYLLETCLLRWISVLWTKPVTKFVFVNCRHLRNSLYLMAPSLEMAPTALIPSFNRAGMSIPYFFLTLSSLFLSSSSWKMAFVSWGVIIGAEPYLTKGTWAWVSFSISIIRQKITLLWNENHATKTGLLPKRTVYTL